MWNVFKKVWVKAKEVKAEYNGQRRVAGGGKLSQAAIPLHHPRLSETGRSMVEMLGVLAIMGVLSIAGVAGYRYALTKYKANEIMNELDMRALDLSAQILNSGQSYKWEQELTDSFGGLLAGIYPVAAYIANRNVDYFEITVSDIPSDVCRHLVRDYQTPSGIIVQESAYQGDPDICQQTDTDDTPFVMSFLYKNDFSDTPDCGDAAEFYPLEQACHCIDDEYIRLDPNTNSCTCISGYAWNDKEEKCYSQLCPEGQFMSQDSGCVDCSVPGAVSIAGNTDTKDSCLQCGNRGIIYHVGGVWRCYNKTNPTCESGKSFRDVNGRCQSCTNGTKSLFIGLENEEGYAQCRDCPNRYMDQGACTLKEMCEKGSSFPSYADTGGTVRCVSCSDSSDYTVSSDYGREYCTACQNESGQSNRELIGDTCRKKICDSDEFTGADGKCYKCDQATAVKVNASGSGCEETSCDREIVNGLCRLKCPTDGTHIQTSSGACYDCAADDHFLVSESDCNKCTPKRDWFGTTQSTASCILSSRFTEGSTFAGGITWTGNFTALSCQKNYFIGSPEYGISEAAIKYCEKCPGKHVMAQFCVSDNTCQTGSQFLSPSDSRNLCVSCDSVNAVYIASGEKERQLCSNCTTTKRFWAGTSCYPCDSGDEPTISTPEEEDSCLSCRNRIIEDGRCIRPR